MPLDALHPPQPSADALCRIGTLAARAWRRWVGDADQPSLDAYIRECCA